MNLWKPAALLSTSALVFVVGYQAAFATPAPAPTPVAEHQPNMEAALTKLREARGFLDRSEHNKGGWRDSAIQNTDRAIADTQRGINWSDR